MHVPIPTVRLRPMQEPMHPAGEPAPFCEIHSFGTRSDPIGRLCRSTPSMRRSSPCPALHSYCDPAYLIPDRVDQDIGSMQVAPSAVHMVSTGAVVHSVQFMQSSSQV